MTTTDVQQPDYGRPEYGRYQKTQRVQLTPEEAKAWQTCMRGSSVITPALISAAIGYGIFKITPFRTQAKYAALVGGLLGLVSGRIAISEICLAKVASMPNSTLKDRLIEAGHYGNRDARRQYQGFQELDMTSEAHGSEEASAEMIFDDYPPMNSYDTYSSLNDSSDLQTTEDTDLTEPINMQKSVSYDELRNRNREEYYKKNKQWYTLRTLKSHPATNQPTQQVPATDATPMQERNKYGDVWG